MNFLTFLEHLPTWHPLLWLLLLFSLVGTTIFLEKLTLFQSVDQPIEPFLTSIQHTLQNGNIIEAIQICEQTKGPIPRIICAGLHRYERGISEMEEGMQMAGEWEIVRLEEKVAILSHIAYVAPLIGMLGTVLGLITIFQSIHSMGMLDFSNEQVSYALSTALQTTAAGMSIAIPSYLAYHYLLFRIHRITTTMNLSFETVKEYAHEYQATYPL